MANINNIHTLTILIIPYQKSHVNYVPLSQQNVACRQFSVWAANPQKVSIFVFVV